MLTTTAYVLYSLIVDCVCTNRSSNYKDASFTLSWANSPYSFVSFSVQTRSNWRSMSRTENTDSFWEVLRGDFFSSLQNHARGYDSELPNHSSHSDNEACTRPTYLDGSPAAPTGLLHTSTSDSVLLYGRPPFTISSGSPDDVWNTTNQLCYPTEHSVRLAPSTYEATVTSLSIPLQVGQSVNMPLTYSSIPSPSPSPLLVPELAPECRLPNSAASLGHTDLEFMVSSICTFWNSWTHNSFNGRLIVLDLPMRTIRM